MKYLHLLVVMLWGFSVYSQETIKETTTILLSQKEVKSNTSKKVFSKTFSIENSENQPFISLSIVLRNAKEDVGFLLRYKVKNDWIEWQNLKEDIHEKQEGIVYKNLFFLPQYVSNVELKTKNGKHFEELELNFFYPEFTDNVEHKKVVYNTNKSLSISCTCPIPAYEDRLDWCPSGNCPAQTSPTITTVTHLIVHHSAGDNTSSDWAATVRGIWNYHVNVRGWSDIGYNYLIDPNGVIYEGRGNNILGAHFSGMNTGTMGVCLLGDYQPSSGNGTPSAAMISSLEELLSWKECDISKDPLLSSWHNASSQNLMHIAGHRDAGTGTECPGDNVYTLLPNIRTACSSYMQNCSFVADADLVVSVLNTNPSTVIIDQNTELVFAVGNGGNADVLETINVDLKVDGNLLQSYTIDSIHAAEVLNFSYPNYIFSSLGNHSLCLYVSAATNETNIANNSYCKTVDVQTITNSDIVVSSISQSIATANIDDDITYEFKIKNIGDAATSENVQGKILVEGVTKQLFNIPILNVNEIFTKTFTTSFFSSGNKEVCIEINSPNNEIEVANNNNCKTTIVLEPNAIQDIENLLSLEIFPNPSSTNLNVNLDLKQKKDIVISIYNSLGKKVFTKESITSKNNINISTFSKGIYFIEIKIDGYSIKKKTTFN